MSQGDAEKKNHRYMPEVDEEKCMGCGLCQDSCESHEVKECMILKNGVMCLLDRSTCLASQPGCEYRCVQICPNLAIKLKKIEA